MSIPLLVGSLLCSLCAAAQHEQQIDGIIMSSDDLKPIPGVTVLVDGSNLGAISDENGRFRVRTAPSSTLRLTHLSFDPKMVVLRTTDSSQHLIIMLDPAQPVQLDTVTAKGVDKKAFTREFKSLQLPDSLNKNAYANVGKSKLDMAAMQTGGSGKQSMILQTDAVHDKHRQAYQTQHIKLFDLFVWYKLLFPRKKKKVKSISY